MKFGLPPDQFEILEKTLIAPIKKKNIKIYIFGSRARGQFHPFSDIDILIEESGNSVVSESEISKIREELEESRLGVAVDIVRSKELAKSYVESVLKERIEL